MKSRAHIKGHPIHPMLVGFPIALFMAALATDVVALVNGDEGYIAATYLAVAGICTGLLAAIPGIIDYKYTVPPKSSGKTRALKHGLLNTSIILLFGIAVLYRIYSDAPSLYAIAGMELVSCIALFFAGWMGGTLVFRNQIGVNPRYANAGKWKEVYLEAQTDKRYIIEEAEDLEANQMILLHIDGERIVLAKTEKEYTAFEDRCPHRGASLAGGSMMCNTVQCPWHGSQFDVFSGKAKEGPVEQGIKTYTVKEENGKVVLHLAA